MSWKQQSGSAGRSPAREMPSLPSPGHQHLTRSILVPLSPPAEEPGAVGTAGGLGHPPASMDAGTG